MTNIKYNECQKTLLLDTNLLVIGEIYMSNKFGAYNFKLYVGQCIWESLQGTGVAKLIPDAKKDSRFRLKACFIAKMEPMYKPRAMAKAKLTATPEPKPEPPEVTPAAVPESVAMGVTVPEPVAMAVTAPTPESTPVPESMPVFKPGSKAMFVKFTARITE